MALSLRLRTKCAGKRAAAVACERRDGCERGGGGSRRSRTREGRRGGAALREGPLPARPALAAARASSSVPGLRAGAAAGARRVGANRTPAFRAAPRQTNSLEPDPPRKLHRAHPPRRICSYTGSQPGRPGRHSFSAPPPQPTRQALPWRCASDGPAPVRSQSGAPGAQQDSLARLPPSLVLASLAVMLKTNPRFLSPGFSSLSSGSLHFSPCSACGPGAHARGLFTPFRFLRGVGVEERAAWVSAMAGTWGGCYSQAEVE